MGANRRTLYERDEYVGIFKPSTSAQVLHECQIIKLDKDRSGMDTIAVLSGKNPLFLGIDTVFKINTLIDEDNRQNNRESEN